MHVTMSCHCSGCAVEWLVCKPWAATPRPTHTQDVIAGVDELPAGVDIHFHAADATEDHARREESTHIEQLSLPPNKERAVLVRFRPRSTGEARGASERYNLVRRTFRLQLRCCDSSGNVLERRVVQCKALVCTSFVSSSPPDIDFGDCNVGSFYVRDVQACAAKVVVSALSLRDCLRGLCGRKRGALSCVLDGAI